MAIPAGAFDKDKEEEYKLAEMDVREVTQKLANKAAIELLKYMAFHMRKEHFKDPRSFSYNKGILHCLMRLSNMNLEDAKTIWKKIPKKEKKYWAIVFETDFDDPEGPKLITDENQLNREKARYIW